MQTFLPFPSYLDSARSLDNKRLGKQRVEGLQLIQIIARKKGLLPNPDNKRGFWNHPAVLLWENHLPALIDYTLIVCEVWQERGFKDTVKDKILALNLLHPLCHSPRPVFSPEFHVSHQSNLIRKDPEFYSPQFPTVLPNLPYIWPK